MKWLKMSIIITRSTTEPRLPYCAMSLAAKRLHQRIRVLSVHGETARDADRLAGDVGGVIGQQEGDEPGIIFRHAEPPHRDGALEPFGDARAVGAFEKAAQNGGIGRAGADRIEDHAL